MNVCVTLLLLTFRLVHACLYLEMRLNRMALEHHCWSDYINTMKHLEECLNNTQFLCWLTIVVTVEYSHYLPVCSMGPPYSVEYQKSQLIQMLHILSFLFAHPLMQVSSGLRMIQMKLKPDSCYSKCPSLLKTGLVRGVKWIKARYVSWPPLQIRYNILTW